MRAAEAGAGVAVAVAVCCCEAAAAVRTSAAGDLQSADAANGWNRVSICLACSVDTCIAVVVASVGLFCERRVQQCAGAAVCVCALRVGEFTRVETCTV